MIVFQRREVIHYIKWLQAKSVHGIELLAICSEQWWHDMALVGGGLSSLNSIAKVECAIATCSWPGQVYMLEKERMGSTWSTLHKIRNPTSTPGHGTYDGEHHHHTMKFMFCCIEYSNTKLPQRLLTYNIQSSNKIF